MTDNELLHMLRRGRDLGFLSGNLPKDLEAQDELLQSIVNDMVYYHVGPTDKKYDTGRQQIILMRDPDGPWNEATDLRLPIFLEGPEWTELFRDVLGWTGTDLIRPGEDLDHYRNRQRIASEKSLPDYQLLSRIWDTYIDVAYQPQEVYELRGECLKVKAVTSNALALQALDKLLRGSDEAISRGVGLFLAAE